ncbi:MAG: zinc ribbon domain-containing protein [Lachnospiraceae bacterium]|nr:zinc ribbon domain-containing protein [Lachnospiraceae bacterium]MDD3617295.1 zinc ribbon domain-containing protein [Lachnospiraceae bacterium]
MYCTKCGNQLEEKTKFCGKCGCPVRGNIEEAGKERSIVPNQVYLKTKTDTEKFQENDVKDKMKQKMSNESTKNVYEIYSSIWMNMWRRKFQIIQIDQKRIIQKKPTGKEKIMDIAAISDVKNSFYMAPLALVSAVACSGVGALNISTQYEGAELVLIICGILIALFALGSNTRLHIVDLNGMNLSLYFRSKKEAINVQNEIANSCFFQGNAGTEKNVIQIGIYAVIGILMLVAVIRII